MNNFNNLIDEKLVELYLDGEAVALDVLVERYLKWIYNFTARLCGDRKEAEDLTQETFLKAWKNLKKFDQKKSFKTWIFNIAKNTSIDYLRKKKSIPFSNFENKDGENLLAENLVDLAPLPPEIFERNNLAREIEVAIAKLPVKYQAVIFLKFNNDFTFQEIADSLDEPLDTVKSRCRRGLALLRKILMENAPK